MDAFNNEFQGVFSFEGPDGRDRAFCKVCSEYIVYRSKCQNLQKHVNSSKHATKNASFQMQIGDISQAEYFSDICKAFVSANIPLSKLNNPMLRNFFKKYTGRDTPDESTIRKKYLDEQYNSTIVEIKRKISDNYFWVSADETTDIKGRCVVNTIIGILNPDIPYEPFLISTQFRNTVNAEAICDIIKNSVLKITETAPEKLLLFVSDSAAVMLRTGKLLKNHFPNALHITCFAHALHRVCEFIREQFSDVNSLINNFKKVLLKAPFRVSLYKEMNPDLSLPPQPTITRWGTWLEAAFFYAQNFHQIQNFILNLPDEAVSIKECKQVLNKTNLHNDLQFIYIHFKKIPDCIKFLENQNINLHTAFEKTETLYQELKRDNAPISVKLGDKIDAIINRNPDFYKLKQICLNNFTNENLFTKYNQLIPFFRYAPVTSCDVERSFSLFKDVLTNKRTSFTETNLEKYLIIYSNRKCVADTV